MKALSVAVLFALLGAFQLAAYAVPHSTALSSVGATPLAADEDKDKEKDKKDG